MYATYLMVGAIRWLTQCLQSDDEEDEDDEIQNWSYGAAEEEEGESIDRVLDDKVEDDKHVYLIKWNNKSHMHNTWETKESLAGIKGFKKLENYIKKLAEADRIRPHLTREELEGLDIEREMQREILEEHTKVERVVAVRIDDETGDTQYCCKWRGVPYDQLTWENESLIQGDFQKEIDDFLARQNSAMLPAHSASITTQRSKVTKLMEQPSYLVGGTLRDYQLEGLNWLAYSWMFNRNVILADEMGLGKTCQSVSFISYLVHTHKIFGPYLVVVPLSTINAWANEFKRWAPDLNMIMYIGSRESRETLRDYEFYGTKGNTRQPRFNVLLTTFEIVLKDADILRGLKWSLLVVDEAHRLKNSESLLHDVLKDFSTANRLLVTGTPLQNSMRELWSLLSFLMPNKFRSVEEFEATYKDLQEEGHLEKLHEELRPHLLRRIKKDVEKSLPSKTERCVWMNNFCFLLLIIGFVVFCVLACRPSSSKCPSGLWRATMLR